MAQRLISCVTNAFMRVMNRKCHQEAFSEILFAKKSGEKRFFSFFFSFHNRAKYLVGLLVKMLNSVKRKIAHEQTLIVLIKVKISVVAVQDKVKVKRVFFFFKCI